MLKFSKISILICMLVALLFAANKDGVVYEVCNGESDNGGNKIWFKLEGSHTRYTILEDNVGKSRADRMYALLLASKLKGYSVIFQGETPNDIEWLILK